MAGRGRGENEGEPGEIKRVDEKLKKGKCRGSLKNKQQTKLCLGVLAVNNKMCSL